MTKSTARKNEKILVIKLSALGDFIQALGPMKAIRAHHKEAHITLLTTKPFEKFGQKCGYFDEIIIDKRPKMLDLHGWFALRKKLIAGHYNRIYDLQNNDRTNLYFRLFPKSKKPEWVGTAKGASHTNLSPQRTAGHAFDGHVQTLALAGIKNVEIDPMDWINEGLSDFDLKPPYVLLVPGCAPQHPQKRWPADHYAALANALAQKGYQPVILGTDSEKDVTAKIAGACPQALDLTGKTTLFQIIALGKNAAGAVGNDTGPMHMIAPTKCPCISLFSRHSNPTRHAPKGKNVHVMQSENLEDLPERPVIEQALALF